MRHVAAYLLAALGNDTEPTVATIKSILGSVGVEADDKQLSVVIDKFAGKKVADLICEGSALLASMPAGGVAASGAVASTGGGSAPAEEKKEEKKEEPEEESDDDMGFGLFD